MSKKSFTLGGLVIASAAGVLLTGSPAIATPTWGGGGGCCNSNRTRFFFGNRDRQFTNNETDLFNHFRIRLRNRNNNVAIARNEQAQADRQNQFERQRQDERQRAARFEENQTRDR